MVVFFFKFRNKNTYFIQDALLGLIQLLATENHLKMMKNAFYFTAEAQVKDINLRLVK